MKRSNRLILLIGVLLAAMAFVGVIMLTGSSSPGGGTPTTTPAPTTAKVVKATIDIAAGTNVTASMVALNEVQIAAAGPDTIPDTGLAIGKTIRRAVTKGETLGYSFFISTDVNNVTDALPTGLRGMAIQVSEVTGVGALIQNGDHVDVIISLKIPTVIPGPVNTGQAVPVAELQGSVKLVVQNVLVVGTKRPLAAAPAAQPSPTPAPSGQASGGGQQPATSLNGLPEMVLVAVTANQAEVIRYAQLYADPAPDNISLVLRSPKDYVKVDASGNPVMDASGNQVIVVPPLEKTDGVILKTLIDKYLVLPPLLTP